MRDPNPEPDPIETEPQADDQPAPEPAEYEPLELTRLEEADYGNE